MRALSLMVVLILVLVVRSGGSKEPKEAPAKPEPKSAHAKMMADKLKNAQLLLDGLATNDFDKIVKSAEDLVIISNKAEFAAVVKSREYELQTNDFRRALETIIKKSKNKNLDGATLAYLDMTLSCVRCHQHTREVRNAAMPAGERSSRFAVR